MRRLCLRMLRKFRRFLPSKTYARIHYEYHTGKKLNLDNPREFNEKIQWYKVFYRPKILNRLVDKYEVRGFVKDKIDAQYLNEVYGVYDRPEEVPFDQLPQQFVIKATHSNAYNLIVTDKDKLNRKKALKLFKKWLSKNHYYRKGQEWAYKDVKPRLIAEKYLEEAGRGSLIDYKFFCFDGIPKFLDVHLDRAQNHKKGSYDLDFNPLPYRRWPKKQNISSKIKKPDNFDEMIQLSKTLSTGFPFVRVDFYSINGKSVFGEMTFYPGDARHDFTPEKYNAIIGDYFKLPDLEDGKTIMGF